MDGGQWSASWSSHFTAREGTLVTTEQKGWWVPEVVWGLQRDRNTLVLPSQYNDRALPAIVDILFQEDRLLFIISDNFLDNKFVKMGQKLGHYLTCEYHNYHYEYACYLHSLVSRWH